MGDYDVGPGKGGLLSCLLSDKSSPAPLTEDDRGFILHMIVIDNKADTFMRLIKTDHHYRNYKFYINQRFAGVPMIHQAITHCNIIFVQGLVGIGAVITIKTEDDGFDALFEAVYQCKWCSFLRGWHSMLYPENRKNLTMEKYYDIIVYLLQIGANPNTVDKDGNTLLVHMCNYRHPEENRDMIKKIVMVLIDFGINTDTRKEYANGNSLETYAWMCENDDILEVIKNHKPRPVIKRGSS